MHLQRLLLSTAAVLFNFLCYNLVFAAVICVGPDVTGDGSGRNWNNIAKWQNVGLVRGNTYYIKEGLYGSKILDTDQSGEIYIKIIKCSDGDAVCGSIEGWSSSLGDEQAVFNETIKIASSYWEIDGVTGGGPNAWKSGHGIKFYTSPYDGAIYGEAASLTNIRLKHIEFTHNGNITINALGSMWKFVNPLYNFYMGYCYIHDISGLPIFARGGQFWTLEYNYMSNPCGCSDYDYNNHCEHLVTHAASDLNIRYNYFKDGKSTGVLVNNDGASYRWKIYGNVFENNNGSAIVSAAADIGDQAYDFFVFNNIFSGGRLKFIYTTGKQYNNLYFNGDVFSGKDDYNYFSNCIAAQCNMNLGAHENGVTLYPNNCDSIGTFPNPFVDSGKGNYLFSTKLAEYPGTDICALSGVVCDSENTYNLDAYGSERGADGFWEIGAYEYSENNPDKYQPEPPRNLILR